MEFSFAKTAKSFLNVNSPMQSRVQSPKPIKVLGQQTQSAYSNKTYSLYDSISSNSSSPSKEELRYDQITPRLLSGQMYSSPSPSLISQEVVSQVNQERENSLNPHEKELLFSQEKLNLTPEQILKDLQNELENMDLIE